MCNTSSRKTLPRKQRTNSKSDGADDRTEISKFALRNMIYRKAWNGVERVCYWRPSQATIPDRVGDYPIHEACLQAAPFHVIQNLITAYPDGVKKKGFCGRLPLHYASYNRPSLNIIKLLLKNYPEGASTLDSDGRLPIHLAVVRNAPTDTIQKLVSAFPRSLQTSNKFGSTPQMLARNEFIGSLLQKEEVRPRNLTKNIDGVKKFKMALSAPNVNVSNNTEKHKQLGTNKTHTTKQIDSNRIAHKRSSAVNTFLIHCTENSQNRANRLQTRRPFIENAEKEPSYDKKTSIFVTTRISIPTPPGTDTSTFPVIEAIPFKQTYAQPYTPNTMVERALLI